jgi:hypothetical protein
MGEPEALRRRAVQRDQDVGDGGSLDALGEHGELQRIREAGHGVPHTRVPASTMAG